MAIAVHSEFLLGDLVLRFQAPVDDPSAVGLCIFPAAMAAEVVVPREHLNGAEVTSLPSAWLPIRAWEVDPLVHLQRLDDPANGAFSQGRTLRGGPSTQGLRLCTQEEERVGEEVMIRSVLSDGRGLECVHEIRHRAGSGCLRVKTTLHNVGTDVISIGLLTSFSVGGISPFVADDAPGRLWLHRFRSAWSAEGRHVAERIEDLGLERSWIGHGIRAERYGQLGSLPTNGWFPFVAVEDRVAGVTWAAQVAHSGSWQMEVYRRGDQLALSGGLADREFGHWVKNLVPGEILVSPEAVLTCAQGGIDEASARITQHFNMEVEKLVPASELALPPIFNEWCTSWGNPNHENLVALADRLQGTGIGYLIIDDGWAERPSAGFQQNGDWKINKQSFPMGLRATAEEIRQRGMIPGIWFEFEVINPGSAAWDEVAHQLQRDGRPLQVGNRRFWDFRDPWVHDFLAEKVTRMLRENALGYLKVDYNDSIGYGCDGAESVGEGLRLHLAGVHTFFKNLRRELPELVIENCSSGGHRLEPAMMALTAMGSSSDAHETLDIPVISANLHRLIPARQNQIWAVMRASDTLQRLSYSLAATFLGRMCLSGDVHALNDAQWDFVKSGIALYRETACLIGRGKWTRHGEWSSSYRHLCGWQVAVCESEADRRTLVVWHAFAAPLPPIAVVALHLPPQARIRLQWGEPSAHAELREDGLHLVFPSAHAGGVILIEHG